MKARHLILILPLLLVAVAALANAASANWLEPFSHTYIVRAELNGKLVVTSRWKDSLERVAVNGRQLYRRTQISTQSNGTVRTWISVFGPEDLSPVSDTFSTSDGEIFARVFSRSGVTNYASSGATKGIITTETVALPVGYSDFNSGQFGLAVLQLPLKPGYRTTLTTFGTTDAKVQLVPLEVLRSETLHFAACSIDTLVARATFAARYYPDEGDNYMTFWLAKTPPYVAKLVTETPRTRLKVTFDLDAASQCA